MTNIQELFNGAIDEETASQLMHAATDAAGFDIVDGFTGEKLRVKRIEIDPAIQTVASSPPKAIPESEVATEKQSKATSDARLIRCWSPAIGSPTRQSVSPTSTTG